MYDEEKGQTWRDYLLEQGIDQLTQVTMLCHAAEEALSLLHDRPGRVLSPASAGLLTAPGGPAVITPI